MWSASTMRARSKRRCNPCSVGKPIDHRPKQLRDKVQAEVAISNELRTSMAQKRASCRRREEWEEDIEVPLDSQPEEQDCDSWD